MVVRKLSLSFERRKEYILRNLEIKDRLKVKALANEFQVSDETIRRDLEKLEKEGLLKKVFGGAIKEESASSELYPISDRLEINKEEKYIICKAAAELVEDGDSIMLGYGSTIYPIVHFLGDKKNLTIITNSVPILCFAVEKLDARVIFAGGEIKSNQKSSNGVLSEEILDYFKVNKVFLSVSAISTEEGLTDYDLNGASISRKMISRGEDVIVLADSSKLGKATFVNVCSLDKISMIITDSKCPKDWRSSLKKSGVELFIAEDF